MTSFTSFTIDTFKKRKELFHLFLIQVIVTFIMYFLIIISNIMTKSFYTSAVSNILNGSVSNYWGAFFIILSIISLIFAGALVIYSLRLMVFYQTKDISTMIGIGGLLDFIENYYLFQLVTMVFISNVFGLLFAYFMVFLSIFITGIIFPIHMSLVIPFPDYQLIIMFFIFFFATYLVAAKFITGTVKKSYEELIQDKIDFNNGKDDNFLARIFIWGRKTREGFVKMTTRISRLNIMRYSFVFITSIIINLLYAFFLVSLVFGTVIISDTANNISYSGVGGENTFMITETQYSSFFLNSFQVDSSVQPSTSNLTNSFFNFRPLEPVFTSFNISNVDDRVILSKSVTALNPSQNINPNNPSNNNPSNEVGHVNLENPFLIALNPSKAIPFWNYYGSNPKAITGTNIFVGEQLAYSGFDSVNPMGGHLYFNDQTSKIYTINSIVLDPMFKGNTVYLDMASYQSLYRPNTDLRNVIFIKLNKTSQFTEFKSAINQVNPNLTVVSLNSIISHNQQFDTQLSLYLFFVGVPLFLIYFVLSDSYNRQIIEERKQQLNLIKILGGNKKDFKTIILKEVDSFSIWGLGLGYIGAMYFVVQMLVPFAVVSWIAVAISIGVIVVPYYVARRRLSKRIDTFYNSYVEA